MPRFVYNQKEMALAIPFPNAESYLKARAELVEAQNATRFDSSMVLSPAEELVNARLIQLRNNEIAKYKAGVPFPPALYFPAVRQTIEASPLFPILKVMPKGAVLHLHASSISSPEALIELTYMDHLYIYTGRAALYGQLHFYGPGQVPAGYEPVNALRATTPGFDLLLYKLITIGPEEQNDPDVWCRFEDIFTRIGGLVSYLPAFTRLLQRALTEYLDDNIQHIEVRSGFGNLYDLEGRLYTPEEQLDLVRQILQNTPGITVNYIYSSARSQPETTVFARMETAARLRAAYPDLIAGFDLVGEEDQGYPLIHFLPDFLRFGELEEKYGTNLPFYFHSGESDWADVTNLYDAVLLGTRRIGHGYNLFYFPILEPILKAVPIPLELCPISNQVLNYVADLRDHPAGGYLNSGVPLTLSSDDPAVYGNTGVTYDFWEALMAWDLDLRSMKQFAYNSIIFSSLNQPRKEALLQSWTAKWDQFIRNFLLTIR